MASVTPITPTCATRTDIAPSCCSAIQIIDRYDEPVACPLEPNSVGNRWGFPPPSSWFEEAAPFIGAKIVRPPHEGDPLTLEKYLGTKSWRRANPAAVESRRQASG